MRSRKFQSVSSNSCFCFKAKLQGHVCRKPFPTTTDTRSHSFMDPLTFQLSAVVLSSTIWWKAQRKQNCFCPHMRYSSGPQPFRHWGPVSWKTIFPWTCCGGLVQAVMRAMGSNGKRQVKLCPPLTSCCAARRVGVGGWGPLRYSVRTQQVLKGAAFSPSRFFISYSSSPWLFYSVSKVSIN